MRIVHTQKFIRMAPRKFSLLAAMVRGMDPQEAIEILPHSGKRAAGPLVKVIKTAVANATQKSAGGELKIEELQINSGPALKRGRAVSRGRWHPYKRRMSHIRVVLETVKTVSKSSTQGKVNKTKVTKKSEARSTKSKTNSNNRKDKSKK